MHYSVPSIWKLIAANSDPESGRSGVLKSTANDWSAFLKTLINIVASRDASGTWAISGSPLNEPPGLLVEAAFGKASLPRPLGLYAAAAVGETVEYRDAVEVATLLRQTDAALVGAVFKFMGIRFLLYLDHAPLPNAMPLPAGQGWITSDLLYHVGRMNVRVSGKLSHYVQFLWKLS